jgi:hypothetical protein
MSYWHRSLVALEDRSAWAKWMLAHTLHIHIYVHTYIHTYIHSYIHTFIHAYMHTYIHTYTHTYIHTYTRYRLVSELFNFSAARFLPSLLFQEPLHTRKIFPACIFYYRAYRDIHDSLTNEGIRQSEWAVPSLVPRHTDTVRTFLNSDQCD